ncbi:hypothetical protein ABIA39_007607 [Nocardia sp. GAS34]|uniref:hypothetical protein n=1 Tax=unclassified Nocardia TaxID=2637762 RepID=UPI003D1EE4AD
MAIGGPLATALDAVWESIRVRHPEAPNVVVAMASGSQGRGRGLRLGHFGPSRWEQHGVWLPELFVGAEGLAAGTREVLGTCYTRPRTPWPMPARSGRAATTAGVASPAAMACGHP